jgi:hypothetical protein
MAITAHQVSLLIHEAIDSRDLESMAAAMTIAEDARRAYSMQQMRTTDTAKRERARVGREACERMLSLCACVAVGLAFAA